MARWQWVLRQISRQLWLRATLIGALGIVAAVVAAFAERVIPWSIQASISADAVESILEILASSMLAVTTFSLGAMTAAYASATSNVTPRATQLLVEDRVTQNVLSTFLGSFLFSMVGVVVLKTGAYGPQGRVILFAVTIGVIVLIVVSLLRWIDHLTRLGRVGETTDRVEAATREALEIRRRSPCLGGRPWHDPGRRPPPGAMPVSAAASGYVCHVDVSAIQSACEAASVEAYLAVLPGAFVYRDTPVLHVVGPVGEDGEEFAEAMRHAMVIGPSRNFDQDPRFGFVVLSEIAARALSPAVNDPGTAIDVVGRAVRLLTFWSEPPQESEAGNEILHPQVHVPPLAVADMFEDAFLVMGRDGAGMIEVALRLQKALKALGAIGDADFRAAAREQAGIAYARAVAAMSIASDRERIAAVYRPSTADDGVRDG